MCIRDSCEKILNYKHKNFRPKNLPALFQEIVQGIIHIRSNDPEDLFYKSNFVAEEVVMLKETITFAFKECIYTNAFYEQDMTAGREATVVNLCNTYSVRPPALSEISRNLLSKMYDEEAPFKTDQNLKLILLIRLRCDLFAVEDIFPHFSFDFFAWLELIILYSKDNSGSLAPFKHAELPGSVISF